MVYGASAATFNRVAFTTHILHSVCLGLIHKVDGVALAESLADDFVGAVVVVERTLDEFCSIRCRHTIPPLDYLPEEPKPLSPRSVASSESTRHGVGVKIGRITSWLILSPAFTL